MYVSCRQFVSNMGYSWVEMNVLTTLFICFTSKFRKLVRRFKFKQQLFFGFYAM